jgi:hypothetical protein
MTFDDYVTWAVGLGVSRPASAPGDRALLEVGLEFASEVGDVAGALTRWLRDGERGRDQVANGLADVAYYWARLCVVSGLAPSTLLARSHACLGETWRGGHARGHAR